MKDGRPRGKTKRLRVLLIAPSPATTGGQAVQAGRLLKLLTNDAEVAIDFLPINPPVPRFLRPLLHVPYARTALHAMLYFPRLAAAAATHDVLHIFAASYWSYTLWNAPAVLLARLFGKESIINYRSGEAEDHLANWRSAVPTLRKADALVAPSGYLVDVFAKYGLPMQSIFNILDAGRFRYRERVKPRPVFLSNRGLEPLYNVACTLRAFHLIQQGIPDAELVVAHDGPCRPRLEALAASLALHNVRFIGRVPHHQIPELYDAADVYLTSPDIDCMPGSILECFASGLPIVATRAGGIPYIVEHGRTGLLVDCGDYQGMAAAALRLLEEDGLALRLSRQGREECRKYDGEPIRGQWIALYRKLAGS